MTVVTPSWEPGTLGSAQIDSVLTDVLADLFGDCWRRGATPEFQQRHFRERLETAVNCATGMALAGLPNTIRRTEPNLAPECEFCHGQPVHDAAEWTDGQQRDPAPCPRCGQTTEPEDAPMPLAAVKRSPIGDAAHRVTDEDDAA